MNLVGIARFLKNSYNDAVFLLNLHIQLCLLNVLELTFYDFSISVAVGVPGLSLTVFSPFLLCCH